MQKASGRSIVWMVCWLIPVVMLTVSGYSQTTTPQNRVIQKATPEAIEFFEKKVRPLLVENCAGCHTGSEPLGKFRVDPITEIARGGLHGPVIVPGDAGKSRLIQAIQGNGGLKLMPPSGKLTEAQIKTLVEWVRRGAPMPESKPTGNSPEKGFALSARRKHWAYQPVKRPPVPVVTNKTAVRNPIDAFLQAKREANGIPAAPPADKRTLLRRVTFDLIGLPPTPAEIDAFLADTTPNAYEKVIDRLLKSPHYGERWGRHWLDLVRYADSMGHEFDYSIFNAYQYRDYVIRAFNADVPYNVFLAEHLAGDLMTNPRRDPATGRNESILGTGFFWLGEGKHSPVDIRQEQADRIDNQIDVLGKAFLAQTISCARCHDHKFDPIPTRDYYALYGILKSSRYQQVQREDPTSLGHMLTQCATIQQGVERKELANRWQKTLDQVTDAHLTQLINSPDTGRVASAARIDLRQWSSPDPAFRTLGTAGDLILSSDPHKPILGLNPRTVWQSGWPTRRTEGVLRSPTFPLDKSFLHLRVAGSGARVRIVIDNFVLIRDPLYGVLQQEVNLPVLSWLTVDLRRWKGHRAYVELVDSTIPGPASIDAADLPAETGKPSTDWVALSDAVLSDTAEPPIQKNALAALPPNQQRAALSSALERWSSHQNISSDEDALAVWSNLRTVGGEDLAPLAPQAEKLAEAEAAIPIPTYALAMVEGTGEDETVFVRGNHRTPGEPAPRLQLAVCFTETKPVKTTGSGRRELVAYIASPAHPLTARVLVNRLWKHHFGVGIVPTTDDFGQMGERPTHPELLDWLASEFVRQGWSIKKMHRLMVLSSAYRMQSRAVNAITESKDPKNLWLHRMNVRRLEAEALRDGLLAVSGRLDKTMFGPGIYPLLPPQDGRGFPPQGPLDSHGRRTIYLAIRRNFIPPFLSAFDFPTPFSTIGRRSVANVPAQSLTLMNSEFVWQQARVWAERSRRENPALTGRERIRRFYLEAFARPPTPAERDALLAYLDGRDDSDAWTEVCHALFNAKEFYYVF